MIFDEKYLRIKLLSSSFGLVHIDPFNIVAYNGLNVPSLSLLTSQSTSNSKSTSSWSTSRETITSAN